MTAPNLNWIANYIWGIADDVLRDVYVRGKYTGKLNVREAAARESETDPLAGDSDRADTIHTESNLHSTESHMAKEAIP